MQYFIGSILTTLLLLLSGKGIIGYKKCGNFMCPTYKNAFEVRQYQNSWWFSSSVEKENDTYEDTLKQNWELIKKYLTTHGYTVTAPLYACMSVNGDHFVTKQHVFRVILEHYKESKLPTGMAVHLIEPPNIMYVREVAYPAVANHEARVSSTSLFKDDLIRSGLKINRLCIGYYDPEDPSKGRVDLFALNDN